MSNRRDWLIKELAIRLNTNPTTATQEAEMIVDWLNEEGVLHLGYGDAEIDIIVDRFKEVFGTTKTSKYDRFAARRLAEKYGSQAVVGIIGLLASQSENKYAPVINSINQLEEKWVSVLSFLRKQAGEGEVIDV